MRVFLAVDLHDTLGPIAHGWGRDVARALGPRLASSLTWVAEARIHVTLHFFGEIGRRQVDAIAGALTGPPDPPGAFDVATGGSGTFPERGRPRVLWLGFSQGARELAAVHAWARERLTGLAPDDPHDRFWPHLTIARVRRDIQPGLGHALREAAALAPAPRGTARVERITLMESVLSPRGPAYRPIAEVPLGAPVRPT